MKATYGALALTSVFAIGGALSAEADAQDLHLKPAIHNANPQGPQNEPLTPLVEQAIQRDTVLIKSLGCSGRLLRSPTGKVLGAITAVHCLETDAGTRKGSDGRWYIIKRNPIAAKTGLNGYNLRTAAVLDRFVVKRPGGDLTSDIALGFDHNSTTPSEIIASYRRQALPQKEILKMRRGDSIFMGSWPYYQPTGIPGKRRQALALRVTGFGIAQLPDGTYPLLNTDVSSTGDGARPSPQASGSVPFMMVNGRPRLVGIAMSANDVRGDVPPDNQTPTTMKIPSLRGGHDVTATCSISYESTPLRTGDARILRIVGSAKEIPGYVSPEIQKAQALAKARDQFKDPNTLKTRINGIVQIITEGKRKQPEKNPDQTITIENPILMRDASTKQSVLAWASPTDPDHLQLRYLSTDNQLFDNLLITPHNRGDKPNFMSSPGILTYQHKPNGGDEFIDNQGLKIGGTVPALPNYDTGLYVLDRDDNGQLTVIAQNLYDPNF